MSEAWDRYRNARWQAHQSWLGLGWPVKVLTAAAFAAFIALGAHLSIPLPWTPVPFSFQILAVLVTGACLGRHYGLLSVAFYILAGALGAQVFANQESTGVAILSGHTAGYIFGFAAAAYLVGWYVEKRRALLDRRWLVASCVGLGITAGFALVALTWIAFSGGTFESSWSATQSLLWLFTGMTLLAAAAAALLVLRQRGLGWEKANLFFVMMAAIMVVHVPGVVVLKFLWPFEPAVSWSEAVALGSTVFLPFDIIKAGMAVGLSAAFLPAREDESLRSPHA